MPLMGGANSLAMQGLEQGMAAQSLFGSSRSTGGGNYDALLKQAQGQYSKILGGYQNALRGQRRGQQRTMQGYNQLQANVLGGLAGAGTARSQEIADQYTEAAGAANQQLINRGLGNTTVASAVGARYVGDQAKQQTLLANELANTTAGYQSQLGLAGLGYQNQVNQARTGLQNQRLGYMGNYQQMLGDWAMRGLGYESQLRGQSLGRGGGGGGGYSGGGGGGGESYADRAWAQNYYGKTGIFAEDPMIPNPFTMGGNAGYTSMAQPLAQPLGKASLGLGVGTGSSGSSNYVNPTYTSKR